LGGVSLLFEQLHDHESLAVFPSISWMVQMWDGSALTGAGFPLKAVWQFAEKLSFVSGYRFSDTVSDRNQ